jgi:acetylornithine deacetylase
MTSLTDAEARVLDLIVEDDVVALLSDLVRVPSVTGSDAESDLQHRCAAGLRAAGLDVDAWQLDLDALRAEPDFPGTEVDRIEGYGVVGTSAGDGAPALVLQGHVDVVPPGDLAKWPDGDPWGARIEGDTLHGRGACDMKAGVVANLLAARAVARSGATLRRPFAVHCVVSEEDGGLGAFATLRRGHLGDTAVLTEPTSGRVVVANAGALTFRLRVDGRAAHASVRHDGVSAVEAFIPLLVALQELERSRNATVDPLFDRPVPYAISVGRVQAGDWASSVPDLLIAEGRMGVALDEDPAAARLALEAAVAQACAGDPWLRDHPATVEWYGGQYASGRLPAGDPLLGEVQSVVEAITGRTPPPGAGPYGSDLRLYAGLGGIPTLHYGPGDVAYAHAPREQVSIRETLDVTRALALLILRRCT